MICFSSVIILCLEPCPLYHYIRNSRSSSTGWDNQTDHLIIEFYVCDVSIPHFQILCVTWNFTHFIKWRTRNRDCLPVLYHIYDLGVVIWLTLVQVRVYDIISIKWEKLLPVSLDLIHVYHSFLSNHIILLFVRSQCKITCDVSQQVAHTCDALTT